MRKPLALRSAASAVAAALALAAAAPAVDSAPPAAALANAAPPAPPAEERVREIFVPFEDLSVLLEGPTERVLLDRREYEALVVKARQAAEGRPPREALLVSADYVATAEPERAVITGTLVVDVLADGLHAVGLDVAGVGLRRAVLDDQPAALGLADDGRLTLFVEGRGRHSLRLEMVAPLQTTAARQILNFRLPVPAAASLRLTVPGDVEVKSGAAVAERTFDEKAGETRLRLLPTPGDMSLVMTLNSRLKRKDRVVVARSVLIDEVTQAYERLHATVSLAVLHRAVDQFRFAVPDGFEVTDVRSPMLARWGLAVEGGRRVLEVTLREETTDTVVLNLSALRTGPDLGAWTLPRLDPLDVVGHVAVVGLLVEDRLKAESVQAQDLLRIDTSVLAKALPATVLEAEAGAVRLRPVVAYYAPQAAFRLAARFAKPPAGLRVMTNVLVILDERGQQARGGFAVIPEEEKLFALDFAVPAGWDVMSVAGEKNEPLPFERYGAAGQAGRVHVRLPDGVPPGRERRVYFHAVHVPKDWFGEWDGDQTTTPMPVFALLPAAGGRAETLRDEGAVAVDARDDLTVRPEQLDRLTPLDENEKARYGLADVATNLAYRYDSQPYQARLVVARQRPRVTAETYAFFRVDRGVLAAHYEIVYDVREARTRRLALTLPKDTPPDLAIHGLDGLVLKEYAGEPAGPDDAPRRRWTVLLNESRAGRLRLAVDFEQRLDDLAGKDHVLPLAEAEGVEYQSGRVAVEGSPELDVEVKEHPRRVDIGELVDAEYQPGRRLLGAYGFVGRPPTVRVAVASRTPCALPPAIVQRAELATALAADGLAQTAARFLLRTKAQYLAVRLPDGSTLWSIEVDGRPAKPQREGARLLVSLRAADAEAGPAEAVLRDLKVVFETPVASLGLYRGLELPAPRLFLHAAAGAAAEEVPLADLVWQLDLPTGYEVIRSEGSVVTDQVRPPELAVARLVGGAYTVAGGVGFDHGLVGVALAPLVATAGKEYAAGRVALRSSVSQLEEKSAEDLYDADGAKREAGMAGGTVRVHRGLAMTRPAAPEAPAPPARPAAGPAPAEEPPADRPAKTPTAKREPSPDAAAPGEKAKRYWALEGLSSLKIDLQRRGAVVTFRSLGAEPRLEITVAARRRLDALAWGLALTVFVAGLALTARPVGSRAAYVVAVALVATLIPVVTGRIELARVTNGPFYAALLLAAYYVAAGLARGLAGAVRRQWSHYRAVAAGAAIVAALAVLGAAAARGAEPARPYVVQIVEPPPPVRVPDDALILPYDPAAKAGVPGVDRVLVPYARYQELRALAYPDAASAAKPPPASHALAGGAFSATLQGEEFLLVEGQLEVDVYVDGYALVPLALEGGVLARADLDGKPARLSVVTAAPPLPDDPAPQGAQQAGAQQAGAQQARPQPGPQAAPQAKVSRPQPRSFVVLYASGKGRHRLNLAVRLRLQKQGGWRVAEGRVPAAPATALALRVPDAGTEVRLGGVADRLAYETKAPGETLATALGAAGALSVRWRPTVSEGQIDQTLTADSQAALDVREDQLGLVWAVALEFRRGEREFFTLRLPDGYLVEKVEGTNVRGWEVKRAAGGADGQTLDVSLLKPAKGNEQFTVSLWRPGRVGGGAEAATFDAPVVGVDGAARHTGRLTIRRSPLLDLRTVEASGVTRADVAADAAGAASVESPLGLRPYQAYQFAAVPFTVRLAAAPVAGRTWADVQTILRLGERERALECRAIVRVEDRPLFRVRLAIPADLKIDLVQAPGAAEWAVTEEAGRRLLTLHLAGGVLGECPVLVRGTLGAGRQGADVDLPRIDVLDVERQEGDLVVQADPAFDVTAQDLVNLERVLLQRVFAWLSGEQRALAKLAFHYTRPDYGGRLSLVARKPDVAGFTVTNSRVTDRSVEDAVLVDLTIKNAGIREVAFLLPAWMKDARVSVPLLRQKTVTSVKPGDPASPVRVRLELQDEVMDQLRILVENDRLLRADQDHEAPIPVLETGRTDRRYVAVESAGRDEVLIAAQDGLEALGRQQKEWAAVAGLLRGGTTQAFIVASGAEAPRLAFRTKPRAAVETAGARILLGRTFLVMDPSGTYRARQTYLVDNRTEQFLQVRLPDGASLWTAVVAGEPVKPVLADPSDARRASVPLVKTAAGDLAYEVVLKYGGRTPLSRTFTWAVDFPLPRTVNIQVELSQVDLWVPETHAWFRFAGTMRRVAEEGEFEAGLLAALNKQAQDLVQTSRFDNPFAKARAQANLKNLQHTLQQFQETAQVYHYNKSLQVEARNAASLLLEAEKEIQGAPEAERMETFDNNDSLRNAYEGQKNVRGRNLVAGLGANWAEVPESAAKPDLTIAAGATVTTGAVKFNDGWLASNRLENAQAVEQQRQSKVQRLDLEDFAGKAAFRGKSVGAKGQPAAPEVAQQDVKQMIQQEQAADDFSSVRGPAQPPTGQPQAVGQQQAGQRQRRDEVDQLVERYQTRLEQRDRQDQQVARAGERTAETLQFVGVGGGGRTMGGMAGFDAAAPATAAPAQPGSGLASLDVELPQRGVRLRFTMPGGEVQVTASAASEPLLAGLARLAGVAAFVVLAEVLRRVLRGRRLGTAALNVLSAALIILGVLGLLLGVLPIAGLAAVVVGIVLRLRLRAVRRREAMAA